jgi:hypothetical protein
MMQLPTVDLPLPDSPTRLARGDREGDAVDRVDDLSPRPKLAADREVLLEALDR